MASKRSLLSSVFGEGSIYEELDEPSVQRSQHSVSRHKSRSIFQGKVQSGALPSLESDDEEDDIEAQTRFRGQTTQYPDSNDVPNSMMMEEPLVGQQEREGQEGVSVKHYQDRIRKGMTISDKEKALWKWANVENLDNFLMDVYDYFLGSGFWAIMLSRVLNLATLIFVVVFSTYITSCIDYSKIPSSHMLQDIKVSRCMAKLGFFHTFVLWIFALFCFMKGFQYIKDVKRLVDIRNFYHYLLDIPESDMQTVSWQHVVSRVVALRDQNLITATHTHHASQNKQRMDLCDIANRLMRQENYLIAMINKETLDLSIPIPGFRNVQFLTKTMEWHLNLCIMDFAFNDRGELRPVFLKDTHRKVLAQGLRRRFLFAGIMNIAVAPFGIIYLTLLYFFQYYGEYHRNPSSIGSRQYTPFAEWKFREFNELSHLFRRRMRLSFEPASRYVNQFPRDKTAAVARFVTFVAGSFAAILGIISLLSPEQFLGLELTKDRTVLFYIGLFTTILAVGRGMIPEESLVFDPEPSIREVAEHTHYFPDEWQGKLHSDWVKAEFSQLYQYKLVIILREVASVIIAPFVLWYSLPKSCEKIVDFFRDFTVHVDGLGYVCTFAVFNFDKQPKKPEIRDNYLNTNDGKMLKSYLNFVDNYNMQPPSRPSSKGKKKETEKEKEKAEDMESSVMQRFNKLYDSQNLHASVQQLQRSTHPALSGILYEPDYETNVDTVASPSSPQPDDGGVLGLLNQFYKQSGGGEAHKI